ncbi:hypothetical protein [Nocardia salmonicida]
MTWDVTVPLDVDPRVGFGVDVVRGLTKAFGKVYYRDRLIGWRLCGKEIEPDQCRDGVSTKVGF